jgi:multiple sugar transport system permease protein
MVMAVDVAKLETQGSLPPRRRLTLGWLRRRLPLIVSTLVLLVLAGIYLMPLYWMFTGSFKLQKGIMQVPPEWWPSNPSLDNWRLIFTHTRTVLPWRWLLNSMIVATGVMVSKVSLSALSGYVFAKKHFWGSRVLFFLILATLMLPAQATLVPLYLGVRKLGLYNSYLGMILPHIASPFGVFLLRQFMQSIPNEMLDAARMDGASEFGLFWRIVMPLSAPALTALGIMMFFAGWNDFMWQLLMTQDVAMRTLPVGVAYLATVPVGEKAIIDIGALMAGGTFGAIPMIILFAVFQRYFVKGIMIGAVKG